MLFCIANTAQGQKEIISLDSLLAYTDARSTVLASNDIKYLQAKQTKLAAILGIADFNANVSLNVTNNTTLPVSLFPAETFGGEPGTFREVQTGIQYTNNLNLYADVKLLNVAGWQNLRLAKININITKVDNKLSKKTMQENIAASYYNIINLQSQLLYTSQNLSAADTIYNIVSSKYGQGIAKRQDVNDALVNKVSTQESVTQIAYMIMQQYKALKLLCDIPEDDSILLLNKIDIDYPPNIIQPTFNDLSLTQSALKEKYALAYYRQIKTTMLPTLSAFGSNTDQQFNTQFSLFDENVKWINSNYIGLKAVWQIPNTSTISQTTKAKYEYKLAQQNTNHSRLQATLDFEKLQIEAEKTKASAINQQQIYMLRADTYQKNLESYREGILSLDMLLNSYNAMVNSRYNLVSALSNHLLTNSKIKINNSIR